MVPYKATKKETRSITPQINHIVQVVHELMDSEGKQRALLKNIVGDNITAELGAFMVKIERWWW